MPPSVQQADGTDIALSRLLLAGNFLTSLRILIIEAMKWTTTETPIAMMARSGNEFPTIPLTIRTAVITAVLTIRADFDAAEVRRLSEIESNHAAFAREYDAWIVRDNQSVTTVEAEQPAAMDIPELD